MWLQQVTKRLPLVVAWILKSWYQQILLEWSTSAQQQRWQVSGSYWWNHLSPSQQRRLIFLTMLVLLELQCLRLCLACCFQNYLSARPSLFDLPTYKFFCSCKPTDNFTSNTIYVLKCCSKWWLLVLIRGKKLSGKEASYKELSSVIKNSACTRSIIDTLQNHRSCCSGSQVWWSEVFKAQFLTWWENFDEEKKNMPLTFAYLVLQ